MYQIFFNFMGFFGETDGTWRQGFFVQLPLDSPYITMEKVERITDKSLSASTISVKKYRVDALLWGWYLLLLEIPDTILPMF